MGKLDKAVRDLVEVNMHGYVQDELAILKSCRPDAKKQKEYFNKNVGAYYKAVNETVGTEQKQRHGGYGNALSKGLTINVEALGTSDQLKLLKDMTDGVFKLADKMGYEKPQIPLIDVIPDVKGVNRVQDE